LQLKLKHLKLQMKYQCTQKMSACIYKKPIIKYPKGFLKPRIMFNRRLPCNIKYHLLTVFYCSYSQANYYASSCPFKFFFFFFFFFSLSAFSPSISQVKRVFLNKITKSVLFGSSFENVEKFTFSNSRQQCTFLKTHNFKNQTVTLPNA